MRFVRIFAYGLAGLAARYLLLLFSTVAVVLFATAVFGLVVFGFLIPVPEWHSCIGSSLEDNWEEGTARTLPFPRMVVFRSEVRHLWLLIVSPLYCMVIAGAMLIALRDPTTKDIGMEFLLVALAPSVTQILTYISLFFAVWWFRERLLLHKAIVGLGTGPLANLGWFQVCYQYFDQEGERRGGVTYVWGQATEIFPVFMHIKNPDFAKPGFGFLFHKFAEIDAKEVPSAILAQARQKLVAQAARAAV